MAARKYGTREQYLKIRQAQSRLRKLEKSGLVKAGASESAVRINRYGEAHFESRSIRDALNKFHSVAIGQDRTRRLTKKQVAEIKATYAHLAPENQPTIKNDRIVLSKGVTVRSRSGKAQIEMARTRRSYKNTFLLSNGWEEKIRKVAAKNPGKALRWEFAENGERPTNYGFPTTEYGVNKMIEQIKGRYVDNPKKGDMSAVPIRLLLEDRYFAQYEERKENEKKSTAEKKKKSAAHRKARNSAEKVKEKNRERAAKSRAKKKAENLKKVGK
ncbi:hypothetical protein GC1_00003 [Gluconobacter phage GC1]|uniref:Uncharacterized protein n=1 Tax=Gluconobacter phage GC1 TaxID=2047788 RepID=A0A2I5AR48_9VIRU|nr:hypothetical protein FDJ08_gp03 [Gluconobacter phage GC1]ATS92571.1 hypothetical protein GC1_00003 [Gluconobacter phage GC1]